MYIRARKNNEAEGSRKCPQREVVATFDRMVRETLVNEGVICVLGRRRLQAEQRVGPAWEVEG